MMGHKLLVHIVQAEGLQQMNHFTGDHPYCVCEVKHADSHAHPKKVATKPVTTGDTQNPTWDETFEIDPWQEGEALEFTIYDKGLLGAKTEGKVELPADAFFPMGFNGMLSISNVPGALLQVEVQILGGPPEQAVPAQACDVGPFVGTGPQKLGVSILQAHGLQHMNHFTGDQPYCTCEVKHMHQHAGTTKIETKPAEGDTMNPFWGETHILEPWYPGESLEFTVYDKGLMGSKNEGKVVLPSDMFFPQRFSGMVQISGRSYPLLHVIVRHLGQSEAGPMMEAAEGATKSKKKKKLKLGKKSKGCC